MKKLVVFLVSLLLSSNTYADQNTVYDESCELLGLVLGKHTLADVQKKLGSSEQFHIGDAAASEDKVCYTFSVGEEIGYLNFGSNSEMAGRPEYKLTSIYLSFSAPPSLTQSNCVPISFFNANVSTKNGLKLGLSRKELEEILGSPTYSDKNTHKYQKCVQIDLPKDGLNYDYWSKRLDCYSEGEAPYYDVCVTIIAVFNDSKLVKLEIQRIESIC